MIHLRAPAYPIRAAYRRVVGLRVVSQPTPHLYLLDVESTHMDSGSIPTGEPIYSLREVTPCSE